MKKLQLLTALFLVAGTINLFASGSGKTIRNSPEAPNTRKQQLSKTTEESGSGRKYTKAQLKQMLADNRAIAAANKANK